MADDTTKAAPVANPSAPTDKPVAPDKPVSDKDVAKANDEVAKADQKVADAEREAELAKMSDEDRKVAEAREDADMARRKAAEAAAAAQPAPEHMTVEEAKVVAPVPADMPAGHHRAQKFGNDPANPKSFKAEHDDEDKQTVTLTRKTPDVAGEATIKVHPEMSGDYERAGWNRTV